MGRGLSATPQADVQGCPRPRRGPRATSLLATPVLCLLTSLPSDPTATLGLHLLCSGLMDTTGCVLALSHPFGDPSRQQVPPQPELKDACRPLVSSPRHRPRAV